MAVERGPSRTATKCPKACNGWPRKTRRSLFTNQETGQLIIAGMGELHLEIIRDRLFREFKVQASAGAPQIAYRETITKPLMAKASSSANPAVAVNTATLHHHSTERKGKGIEIENKIVGGAIPKEYIRR